MGLSLGIELSLLGPILTPIVQGFRIRGPYQGTIGPTVDITGAATVLKGPLISLEDSHAKPQPGVILQEFSNSCRNLIEKALVLHKILIRDPIVMLSSEPGFLNQVPTLTASAAVIGVSVCIS